MRFKKAKTRFKGEKIKAIDETRRIFKKRGDINYWIKGNIGHIDYLRVKMLSRNKGIGKQLTEQAINEMKKKGVKKIRTYIYSLNQEAVKKILEQKGFKKIGYKNVFGTIVPVYELRLR